MRKIAIYCRVSTEEQAKNKEGSITSQIQRLKMKVDEKNAYENGKWGKIVSIYQDAAYSGKNTDRPEFQRMLADVKRQRINTILVTELSRLSRSVTDFLNFIKELEDHGCDFICLQYDFDTTSPAGKVFMTIIMALAQFERELTAERIKNNFHARALRGLSNGGTPFLGYDKDPANSGKLLVNKDEALIVREIFDYFVKVSKTSEVAQWLNKKSTTNKSWTGKDGKSRGGKKFTRSAIWRILTNPAYIGKREVNKTHRDMNPKDLKPEEHYQLVNASWKPLIDNDVFEAAQGKLNWSKRVKTAPTHDFILSGLLVCDECGKTLGGHVAHGRNGKHFYYEHNQKSECRIKRYPAISLENLIKRQVFTFLNHKSMNEEFRQAVAELSELKPQTTRDLLKLKSKEIKSLRSDVNKLMDLVTHNQVAKGLDTLLERLKQSEDQLKSLESEHENLEQQALLEVENNIDAEFILNGIKKLRNEQFRKASLASKREIVRGLIKSIHIHPDNVIRMDFWGSEERSEAMRTASRKSGVVLPFRELGRPLEASFQTTALGGERYAGVKKAMGLGIYVGGFHGDGLGLGIHMSGSYAGGLGLEAHISSSSGGDSLTNSGSHGASVGSGGANLGIVNEKWGPRGQFQGDSFMDGGSSTVRSGWNYKH